MAFNDGNVPSIYRQKPRGSKSILQANPKYQASAIAAMVDTDKRDDQPQQDWSFNNTTTVSIEAINAHSMVDFSQKEESIPRHYVDTIIQGFGHNVDLFKDVLHVSPDAEPRQLRISYFRRGREVLSESGLRGFEEFYSGTHVPEMGRIRFQAVNMAYEIVSTPAWRSLYLQKGLGPTRPVNTTTSRASYVPAIESVCSRHSVRWNEQVEELVYDRDPNEGAAAAVLERKVNRKKKRPKAKIYIEEETILDEHLAKLDAEAEPHFVTDFFDSLEESLDGFLNFAASGEQESLKAPKTTEKEVYDENQPLTSTEQFGGFDKQTANNDEDSFVGKITNQLLRRPSSSDDRSSNPNDPIDASEAKNLLPLSSSEERSPAPFRCVSPDPCREVEDAPDDEVSEGDVISVPVSGSVATDRPRFKATRVEDIFDGIEEELLYQNDEPSAISLTWNSRPRSPGNVSMVSDLSESVSNHRGPSPSPTSFVLSPNTAITEGQTTASPDLAHALFNEVPEEDLCEDDWCDPAEIIESFSLVVAPNGEREQSPAIEEAKRGKVSVQREESPSHDEGFLESLSVFVQALVQECESMGKSLSEVNWKDAVLSVFVIDDADMDYLMDIVSAEIKKTPPLHSDDAMGTPTQLVVEAAQSFS